MAHKAVRRARFGAGLVYRVQMLGSPAADTPSGLTRRLLLLAAVVALALAATWALGRGDLSLEALLRHRAEIDAFVTAHGTLAVLAYLGLYIGTVALSLPGATILTVIGGFLFGLMLGGTVAAIGATLGATIVFLVARTALGEPLLRRAGPRARLLAQGFRADAFSYLLFLRLVPAFPFFLVNLVPAFAGVRLGPFVAATALGVIPASFVYALAGTGLDSVIMVQKKTFDDCLAAGRADCRLAFDPRDVLTPELVGALVALGLLALVPVLVKRVRGRARAAK
jgi:uncharacterized membrane protein YdjX (TVP38/TMEM64 family)